MYTQFFIEKHKEMSDILGFYISSYELTDQNKIIRKYLIKTITVSILGPGV
jgi:hypothetical protein